MTSSGATRQIEAIPPERFYAQNPKTPAKPPVTSKAQQVQNSDPTPQKESSHGVEKGPGATVRGVRDRLKFELGDFSRAQKLHLTLLSIIRSFNPTLTGGKIQSNVESFLARTEQYAGGRWVNVPKKAKLEARLYRIFGDIFHDIASFELFQGRYIHGRYQDVHALQIKHELDTSVPHAALRTSPDSVILECDRCTKSCDFQRVRYCHVRNAFDIKTQANAKKQDNSMQLASYARQILAEQPGRAWVPSLIVTESQFRFFGFDRSGAWYSSWQDLHKDAVNFVLAALVMFGCDSLVGNILPLESPCPSDHLWRKHGNITFVAEHANGDPVRAEGGTCWTRIKPLVHRHTIRGRGTTCAAVEDLDIPESIPEVVRTKVAKTPLLVKMYWKADGRLPEWEFLLKARGMAGVGQLVGYGADDRKVSVFRGTEYAVFHRSVDRTLCHILLERYDGPLSRAPTLVHFLEAVRDAVSGHRHLLFNCRILHRDISVYNIVYASQGGPSNRGRIIDLDLAVDVGELWSPEHRSTLGDGRTGTKAYMSCKLLCGCTEKLGPHDHMDDLESFFYVLCHLLMSFAGSTRHLPDLPTSLKDFESPSMETCTWVKRTFVRRPFQILGQRNPRLLPHFHALRAMLQAFRELFSPRVDDVESAAIDPEEMMVDYPSRDWSAQQRLDNAERDYSAFINALETCIEIIRASGGDTISDAPQESFGLDNQTYAESESSRAGTNVISQDGTNAALQDVIQFHGEDEEIEESDDVNDDDDDDEPEPFEPWEDFTEDVLDAGPSQASTQGSGSLHPDMARMSVGVRGEKRASDEGDNTGDDTRRQKKAK